MRFIVVGITPVILACLLAGCRTEASSTAKKRVVEFDCRTLLGAKVESIRSIPEFANQDLTLREWLCVHHGIATHPSYAGYLWTNALSIIEARPDVEWTSQPCFLWVKEGVITHVFANWSEAEEKLKQEIEATKTESRQPNQALQTTPMTRSVYEKTIEFGRPQRGV